MSLRRFYQLLFRHRTLVLIALAAALTVSLALSTRLGMREDILEMLPSTNPEFAEFKRARLGRDAIGSMIVMIGPRDEATSVSTEQLIAASDMLVDSMLASNLFSEVIDRRDAADYAGVLDWLRARRAALFTEEDHAWLAAQSTPDAMQKTLAMWRRLLMTNPAPYMARSLYEDPFGYDARLAAKLQRAIPFRDAVSIRDGRVFTPDGRRLMLQAIPRWPATDSFHAPELVRFMESQTMRIERKNSGLSVAWISGQRFSLVNADWIKRDVKLTLTLATIAIALCVVMVYRRRWLVALTFAPIILGGILATGAIALARGNISGISIGCGSALVGITIDLGVYALFHIDRIDRTLERRVIIGKMLELARPILLCAATTMTAFVALLFSDLPGYRDLGLFALDGYVMGTIISLFVLPIVIPRLKKAPRPRSWIRLDDLFMRYLNLLERNRRTFAMIAVSITLFCAAGLTRLGFEGDYRKLGATTPEITRDLSAIQKSFGPVMSTSSIVARGRTANDALREAEKTWAVLLDADQHREIVSMHSITPIVPSVGTQRANIARWRAFWTTETIARVRVQLAGAAHEARIRPETFDPFFDSLAAEPVLIDAKTAAEGLPGELLAAEIMPPTPKDADWLVLIGVRAAKDFSPIEARLRAAGVHARVHDENHFMRAVVSFIHGQMGRVAWVSALLFLLTLLAFERNPRRLARMIAPVAACFIWCFGALGWLGIRVDLVNSIVIVILFGVVADYAIFLMWGLETWRRGDAAFPATSGIVVILSAVSTTIGFAAMIVASHPALRSIGIVTLTGMVTGLAAVYLIVPLLEATRQRSRSRHARLSDQE